MVSRLNGLFSLNRQYKAVLSDIWGVLHNGVRAYDEAVDALIRFRENGGYVVLITNAPRPNGPVHEQLADLNIPRSTYDSLVTSGDVTRLAVSSAQSKKIFHIGPSRDMALFEGLDIELVAEEQAGVIVCTGLEDDVNQTPDDYDAQLERLARRELPLICANPDMVVERGSSLIYCAGALAKKYRDHGGETILVGKPCAPIYKAARELINTAANDVVANADILTIGDGLPTDIRGANNEGFDALFITAGIHGADFGPADQPKASLVNARLKNENLNAIGYMPHLIW